MEGRRTAKGDGGLPAVLHRDLRSARNAALRAGYMVHVAFFFYMFSSLLVKTCEVRCGAERARYIGAVASPR